MDLKWRDAEDIAIRLVEEHPDADPLTIRFWTCTPGSSPSRTSKTTQKIKRENPRIDPDGLARGEYQDSQS